MDFRDTMINILTPILGEARVPLAMPVPLDVKTCPIIVGDRSIYLKDTGIASGTRAIYAYGASILFAFFLFAVPLTASAQEKSEKETTAEKTAADETSPEKAAEKKTSAEEPPSSALRQLFTDLLKNPFDKKKTSFAILTIAICGTVLTCTELARRGKPFYVRPIAGLKAIEEAVGRATEMGKPMLFVPGIVDVNEIDTVAGLTVLSTVAKFAAEYDTPLEVPTARALVMTAAREAVHAAALAAGRPDYYNEDRIYYVTDEQFGYVASVCGWMYREKPAACFYLGKFYAESLILAETGNAVSAIQIAGTAETAQLPFFVAACDYTLLGEELFAASAYLSGEPAQLGMLKGQDFGKLAAMFLIVIGCTLATWDSISPRGMDARKQKLPTRTEWITGTVLKGG